MAATNQQILDEARDSLLRILQTDTSAWSEEQRSQQQVRITELESLITRFEARTAADAGRRIIQPIRRVDL